MFLACFITSLKFWGSGEEAAPLPRSMHRV